MLMFLEQTPLMISIWIVMTLSMLSIILSAIFINIFLNKNYKNGVLTARKITLLSVFLSILLIQTVIDIVVPSFPGMPSFESMTTITVGFLFGPIEGILFGWVADLTIVIMHGWQYQILPGLMMPMIGLIAAMMGSVYRNKSELKMWKSISIFQISLLLMMIIMIVTVLTADQFVNYFGDGGDKYLDIDGAIKIAPFTCSISIVILEIIFFYIYFKNKNSREIFLLTLILLVSIFERSTELIVRPFSQVYYNPAYIYATEFYIRLLRSSYLIPSVAIASFVLIKTTAYAIDYN